MILQAIITSKFHRSLFHTKLRFFLQNKKQLLPVSQRAAFATQIIKLVKNSKKPEKISDKTLRDLIMKIDLKDDTYEFDPQYNSDILKMFNQGIFLNYDVFSQSRITQADEQYTTEQQMKEIDEETKKNQFLVDPTKRRFIFYPNHLVTRNIFENMLNSKLDYLICGGFGISKTISIIFYIQLSNYINQLQMEAKNNPRAMEEKINLIKKGFIFAKHPKYWYWTVDVDKDQIGQQFIKNLIKEQATQLSAQQISILQQCQTFEAFARKIDTFYNPIRNIVVIDQINSLVSSMQKWNKALQRYNQAQRQGINPQSLQTDIQAFRNPAKQVYQKFLKFKKIGKNCILNSSVNLKRNILYQVEEKDKTQRLSLNLPTHNKLKQVQIPFQINLTQRWGKIAFLQYVWFEIEKLLRKKISTQSTERIKAKFESYVEKHLDDQTTPIVLSYYRLLHIKQFITTFYIDFSAYNVEYLQRQQEIQKFFFYLRIYVQLDWFNKFKQFSNKRQQLFKKIITAVYFFAQKQIQKGENCMKTLEFKIQELSSLTQMKTFQLIKFFQSQENNKEFIFFFKHLLIVKFLMSPLQYINFIRRTFFRPSQEQRQKYYQHNKKIIDFFQTNSSSRGNCLEYFLLKCFIPGTTVKFEILTHFQQNIPQTISLKKTMTPIIPFQKINKIKSSQDHNIDSYFQQIFKACKDMKNQWFVGIPCRYNQQKQIYIHQSNNPSTDFVFVAYLKKNTGEYFFKILSFDVTVSTQLGQKIKKAKNLFQSLSQGKKYDFTHFIISPNQAFQKNKNKIKQVQNQSNRNLKIRLISLDSLKIENCPDKNAAQTFKIIKNLKKKDLQFDYKKDLKKPLK